MPIKDKYEAILAVDIAMALIQTFSDEHRMVSHNLLNMHLSEELKDAIPSVILAAIYSLVIQASGCHVSQTVYYAVLMNSIVYNAREMFKKFKGHSEDVFVQAIFQNCSFLTPNARARATSYMSTFLS